MVLASPLANKPSASVNHAIGRAFIPIEPGHFGLERKCAIQGTCGRKPETRHAPVVVILAGLFGHQNSSENHAPHGQRLLGSVWRPYHLDAIAFGHGSENLRGGHDQVRWPVVGRCRRSQLEGEMLEASR